MRSRIAPATAWPRLVAATVLALLALALLTTPASAHAYLLGADPADGSELEAAPETITLTFNEPIGTDAQSLRLFDTEGERVDDGPVDTDDAEVGIAVPTDLEDGAYVVAYRVVSADSHPIAGTLTFTIGDALPLDASEAAALAGGDGGAIAATGAVLRGVGYLAVLLAAGAVAFTAFVGRRPSDRRRAAQLGWLAALVGIGATVLHLPVQAANVAGQGLLDVLTSTTALGSTLTSTFGTSALVRLAALGALVALWHASRRDPSPSWVAPGAWVAGAAALGSYLLDGHQRTVEPGWLLLGGDVVHLAGAAVWAAGLVLLYGALRDRRRDDDPTGAARLVARFSGVALVSVVALSAAGTAMSLPLVRSVDALTSTTYGWLLLAKVGLVVVLVGIAAHNRRNLVPAIVARAVPAGAATDTVGATSSPALAEADGNDAAWSRLTGTVRVEIAVVAIVGLLTGFLATTQPAAEAAGLTGPVAETAALTDGLEVDFVVDPAEPGLNALHVYVVEPSGQPSDRMEDLRLEFTYVDEGIGPIEVEPFVAGPGHWTANVTDLTFAGSWEVRIIAGEDRFTQHDVTIPFELAG